MYKFKLGYSMCLGKRVHYALSDTLMFVSTSHSSCYYHTISLFSFMEIFICQFIIYMSTLAATSLQLQFVV